MQIIDVHTHIVPDEIRAQREAYCTREPWFACLYGNPRARLAGVSELVASLDRAGVTAAVAFGFAFRDPGLCELCNDYVLDAARRHPGRVIPFAVTNPAAGLQGVAVAERALALGAAGLGELMPTGQGYALADAAALDPLMALAHEADVPVMVHVNEQVGHDYAGKADQGPREALALARRYPQVRLVFSHLGGGLPFYELMPEVRAELRNVSYDTAAAPLLYEDAALRHILAWAPDKLLWGSDYPLLGQRRFLERVRGLSLEEAALAGLLHDNACRLLKRTTCADKES